MTAIDAEARTCGCLDSIHPGLTHEEHMDIFDAANNELLRRHAVGAANWAMAAMDHVAKAEIQRLAAKVRMMEQGFIRDVSRLDAKERRAYEAAREKEWNRALEIRRATPDTAVWHTANDFDEQEER